MKEIFLERRIFYQKMIMRLVPHLYLYPETAECEAC